YGGHVLQLSTGDKGSYLYANFGALVAHEDDALRATLAALDLQAPPGMPFIDSIQLGVASGEMCVGAYGSAERRTYGALGDKTNMAARLMAVATDGILCDEVAYQGARGQVEFEALPPIQVKGREEPLPVFRPTGTRAGTVHHSMIDKLPPTQQMLLKIASVIGPDFETEVLAAVYPDKDEHEELAHNLAQLAQTGLVVEQEGHYIFANTLIREAAYGRMLFAQRRGLHRALAAWYEERAGQATSAYYIMLADHWQRAEEIPKTMHYLEKAAELARAEGEVDTAVRLYDRALKLEAQAGVLSEGYENRRQSLSK
ncbi:MAG: adenylate/guanylate cyclase domain-containing protein, partial [Candidatus Promineifilaceae bacterium]|nr:adenylate/guanylate cyclase domain-containing protein [Candidatus Promineifilaceae bacterium]